jgi:hypothetical protein
MIFDALTVTGSVIAIVLLAVIIQVVRGKCRLLDNGK